MQLLKNQTSVCKVKTQIIIPAKHYYPALQEDNWRLDKVSGTKNFGMEIRIRTNKLWATLNLGLNLFT